MQDPGGGGLGSLLRGPRASWAPPALGVRELLGHLPVGLDQAINVESSLEVVVLVLEDARKPSACGHRDRVSVRVVAAQDRAKCAAQRVFHAGDRQAALGFVGDVWFDG